MESLLTNELYTFIGVNVTGDFHKIGRDFNLFVTTKKRVQTNVINLGKYACLRDVVENGSVGLGKLCEVVLQLSIDKSNGVHFSDWNKKELVRFKQSVLHWTPLCLVRNTLTFKYCQTSPCA